MNDVLTKEERDDIEHRRCIVNGVEADFVVRMVDRLVAEVDRLRDERRMCDRQHAEDSAMVHELRAWRDAAESQYGRDTLAAEVVRVARERDALLARSEKLEAVAKAAAYHMTRTDTRHTPACLPGETANEGWCSTCAMEAALSALNAGSGGET